MFVQRLPERPPAVGAMDPGSEPQPSAASPAREGQGPTRSDRCEEFSQLFARHWNTAYTYAYRLAGDRHTADDLLQQAAVEAFEGFDQFQRGTRFDRWLLRILHNTFVDLTRRRRRTSLSLDDVPSDVALADLRFDPEAAAENVLPDAIHDALLGLPIEYRSPVVLVDLMDYSYAEAAVVLRCPPGTIRSRLHRGRLALRHRLQPYLEAQRAVLR
jgi:RNA polymerase sigma-70 factor (ECF subfamily)